MENENPVVYATTAAPLLVDSALTLESNIGNEREAFTSQEVYVTRDNLKWIDTLVNPLTLVNDGYKKGVKPRNVADLWFAQKIGKIGCLIFDHLWFDR